MLQLDCYPFELPFEYPFTISKGTKTHQKTLIVSLGMGRLRGYGEAPAISYYGVTVEDMLESLEKKRALIERYALTDPQRFWHFLHHLLPGRNFLIAALDIAGWDLFARLRGMPLRQLLRITGEAPMTDYTLGHDTAEQMLIKMQAHPWPIYKIKIKSADDIRLIEELRKHTASEFRIDANECLNLEDTLRLIPELEQLGVSMLEQPLPKEEWEAMKELKAISSIPIYADESCVVEEDVARCAEHFHGINIKLTKCGGITPSLRMIEQAKSLGLKIMLGAMCESSVGTAALAHIMPLADMLDADGPLLLQEDPGDGLIFENGMIQINNAPGTGIRFKGN